MEYKQEPPDCQRYNQVNCWEPYTTFNKKDKDTKQDKRRMDQRKKDLLPGPREVNLRVNCWSVNLNN